MSTGLLERTEELTALGAAARAAAEGAGGVVLLRGEAGIGKSALVRALPALLPAGSRLLVGYADALATPRALGPVKDIAPGLGPAVGSAVASGERDEVMAAVHAALATGPPTALVVEDAHWADEATVDVLRFLARRVSALPVLLIVTFRDDEIDRGHALAGLVGDLARADGVLRLPLRRLSLDAVRRLTDGAPLEPATVQALTDGNPYLVTELVASAGTGSDVPATVVDGVLARLRRLPRATQAVVEQAAVIPRAVRRPLLDALVPDGWRWLTPAEEKGLVVVRGGAMTFRHELTRRAVLDSLPGARRSELERAALTALERLGGADLSELVHHAVACGDDLAVSRHAPAAAREASASGAHREAVRHYQTALTHEELLTLAERAEVWDAYAVELYTVGHGTEIVAAGQRAVQLRRELGDPAALAQSLRWLSRLHWYAGERPGSEAAATEARQTAELAGDPSLIALTLSNESQLAMLADDDRAVPLAERAIALARELGDLPVLSHALNNLGTAQFRRGDDGSIALRESIAAALACDDHEDACRAYVNLGWSLLDRHDLDGAEEAVTAGLEHAGQAEYLAFWQYLQSVWARIRLGRAEWAQTWTALEPLTPDAPPSWCVGLNVRACLEARTGAGDPARTVGAGWALAQRLGEPQRMVPMAVAALEVAALTGTRPTVDARPLYTSVRRSHPTLYAPQLAYRMRQVRLEVPDLAGMMEEVGESPYALMLAGRWQEAAALWRRLGWPYEEAEALAGSPEPEDNLAALVLLDALGGGPLAQQVRRRLRRLGARSVPRGPAGESRADPAGLTARQQLVMTLLAEGCSNAEIAARLTLSVRTVESHVAAILTKLGTTSRRDAVARYRDLVRDSAADLDNPAGPGRPRSRLRARTADLGTGIDRSR